MEQEEFFSPSLFLDTGYVYKTFTYVGIPDEIKVLALDAASSDFDLTGQLIWPSSRFFCRFILQNENMFCSKNILELGSGIGLAGLLAAHFGRNVCLSDGNELVVENLKKNVSLNFSNSNKEKKVFAHKFVWGVELEEFSVLLANRIDNNHAEIANDNRFSGFDVIFGVDTVFWRDGLKPLFESASSLLSNHSDSKLILCYPTRAGETEKILWDISKDYGFEGYFVNLDELCLDPEFAKKPGVELFRIICFSKKKKSF